MPRQSYFGPPDIDPGEAAVRDFADHGFNHLNLPILKKPESELPTPPDFRLLTAAEKKQYLSLMHRKLEKAAKYINEEHVMGLDYDRPGLYKEAIPVALAQGPVKLDMNVQAHIRLLMDQDLHLKHVFENNGYMQDAEVTVAMQDYIRTWNEVRHLLVWQTPGETEAVKTHNVQKMMKDVFGDIVDE
ncbi:hypothetical protein T440DRAFT_410893 [Plenodomus tracheiphilus IPT5]|uniref:Uncharacterized protein n=1 Tax=Plenodomus tracheiphilus IPT5 TaxID=1408161 RepID=A0A6A7AM88_9PLEO|nr:hypothetical protein T440DRAFT_410893 [Plenodomus tracheiphilus IPT5]